MIPKVLTEPEFIALLFHLLKFGECFFVVDVQRVHPHGGQVDEGRGLENLDTVGGTLTTMTTIMWKLR